MDQIVRHHALMAIWGIYSDIHPEVELLGDDTGLCQLADLIDSGHTDDLLLGDAPTERPEGSIAPRAPTRSDLR